jgi:hypothetical protein
MERNAKSFTIRGESGIFKIVSDLPFMLGDLNDLEAQEAECDIAIESNGFRVNRIVFLAMRPFCSFLNDLNGIVRARAGTALFRNAPAGLSIKVSIEGVTMVQCDMDDRNENKDNALRVKYPIESSYFEELEETMGTLSGCSPKAS